MIGLQMHELATKLFPINRSITGTGVRATLEILKTYMPNLNLFEVPSGTLAFDWKVPKEWIVRKAYIICPNGEKICDFDENNLHLLGYSIGIHKKMNLLELNEHLYSLPEQPTAVPYITSYYEERWGFCISHNQRVLLEEGEYEVFIDAELFEGNLIYGELLIEGSTDEEILISTYVCHPSMANNELSGPVVTTFLASYLQSLKNRKYNYRIVFVPETIGSIVYISRNIKHLKSHVKAGFNVTCVGDDRDYSYLPSRDGNTISDQIAKHVLKNIAPDYKSYKWTDRGSDERQYCAPGVNLPIASIMRTKYGMYPEYHTSLDDLENVVTPAGLKGGFEALKKALEILEKNCYPKVTVLCEPQLGKRGLYPTLSTKDSGNYVRLITDLITYADGKKSLLEIADEIEVPVWDLYDILETLIQHKLIET